MRYNSVTKIVFVISELKIGGAEKILHDLALKLHQDTASYQVAVVCLYKKGKLGEDLSNKGVEIHEGIMNNKFDITGVFKFVDILKRKNPHILYIAGQTLTQMVTFISSIFVRIPVSVIRLPSYDLDARPYYRALVNKISLYQANKIICVSMAQKENIINKERIASEKIEVIYNGVDIDKFKPDKTGGSKSKFLIPDNSAVIGVVACLRKEKALDALIKAMPHVLTHCLNVFLVIAGNGKEYGHLRKTAEGLGISSNIRFLGEREDIADIIPLFDIACLSSVSGIENFSNSILEYMSCGKPVITTKVGGIPEMITHGFNGLLVNSNSPHELAEGIISLINNKGLCASMGANGRKTAEEKFGLEIMLGNYKRFFERIRYENIN
nr:glycosyltransferase family 4 protein [Candidatus Omnitrophota bacterium]